MTEPLDPALNLRAYQRVEAPENYRTRQELEDYRSRRLADMAPAVSFIEKHVGRGHPLRVLEYCSGSSCLLYALERKKLLERGVGIEIAENRHRFAESWKADIGAACVTNLLGDARDFTFDPASFDLVLLVDSAFNYFRPESPDLPDQVLAQAGRALDRGGRILLDMMTRARDLARCREEGVSSYWFENPPENPFRFSLYRQELLSQEEALLLTHNVYIRRDGFIDDSKREVTRLYAPSELSEMLGRHGFHSAQVFEDFLEKVFAEGRSERLVLLATKQETA